MAFRWLDFLNSEKIVIHVLAVFFDHHMCVWSLSPPTQAVSQKIHTNMNIAYAELPLKC